MGLPAETAKRWVSEAPIYLIGAVLFAVCIALLAAHGIWPEWEPILANARLFLLFGIAIFCVDAGRQLAVHRPKEPVAHLRSRYTQPEFVKGAVAGLPLLAACIILLPFFSKMKAAIPLFNSYSWDSTFIAWDRAIFAGHDAWQVLQPVFGYSPVTAFLALLYQLWFLLLYPGCLYFIYAARPGSDLRRRFFLTYVLSWTVVGGAMATWLASVGPVFVGPLLGNSTFDAQMDYLRAANESIPVMTLTVQQMLLDWYHADANGLGSGITAMPSMHIAIAYLYWLAMREVSPRAGRAFGVFLVLIWIGSVHLAYHYAVDGLVSVIAVTGIWWLSRRLFAAWDRFLESRAQATFRTNTVPAE